MSRVGVAENCQAMECGLQMVSLRAFLMAQMVKNPPTNAGDPGLIPELGRSPEGGTGYPLQYSWASLVVQLVKNPPAM